MPEREIRVQIGVGRGSMTSVFVMRLHGNALVDVERILDHAFSAKE